MLKTALNVDKAMRADAIIIENDVEFFDVRNSPFEIYGLYSPKTEKDFKRTPDEVALKTSEGVGALYLNTAGGRARFSTDSPYVIIRAEMPAMCKMSHFSITGSCGFDLYTEDEWGNSHFEGVFKPLFHEEGGYESKVLLSGKKHRYMTINFPTYSNVRNLYIGIEKGSTLGEGLKYIPEKPVVFYGSSITQGGCASRPGNTYESVISQRMNIDHINLGFSGSGRGEETIARYISELDMSAFVLDYDHNSPSEEHLSETHYRFYKTVRNAKKDIPIIIMSRCDFEYRYQESILRRNIIFETYQKALSEGDKNVYYIDGEGIFEGPYKNACTVDTIHPNDLGFVLMADAVESTLKKAFSKMST